MFQLSEVPMRPTASHTLQSLPAGKRQTATCSTTSPAWVRPPEDSVRRFGSVRGVKLATQDEVAAAIARQATIVKSTWQATRSRDGRRYAHYDS